MALRALYCLMLLTSVSSLANAAYLQEYFDYGATASDFSITRNGGSGWTGAWAINANMKYQTTNLTYNAPGYVNWGNEASTGSLNGTATTTLASRSLNGMTGTVWISFLTQQTSLTGDVLFWLDLGGTASTSGTTRDFVALRGSTGTTGADTTPEPVLSYQGPTDTSNSDITSNNTDYAINTTHLVLLKIEMNASSTVNDHITFWVDPDLSAGEPLVGTAAYFRNTKDAYGTTLDAIAASFSSTSNSYLDALRISDEANGFLQVTAIPEPGSVAICAMAGLAALYGYRRRSGCRA